MGTTYSDLRKPFSKQVPKHLRPAKLKKAPSTSTVRTKPDEKQDQEAAAAANSAIIPGQQGKNVFIPDNSFLDIDQGSSILVGSGPRGAFKWFKGRRFLTTEQSAILPNDQIELDRMRVLSFIIRWIFKGNVVAPVEEQLKEGMDVLNLGYGPGMWTGHHIIDMALDYRKSKFTTVDICDLLPADFEKSMMSGQQQEQINVPRTMFTPHHPNVPPSLDNNNQPLLHNNISNQSDITATTTTTTTITTTTATESSSFDDLYNSTMSSSNISFPTSNQPQTLKRESSSINTDKSSSSSSTSTSTSTSTSIPQRRLLPNLDFYMFNPLECRLPFEDNQFDFVMQRMVTAAYSQADWKHMLAELLRVTKPGGYIQLIEVDYYTVDIGPKGKAWETHVIETIRLKRQMEPRMARYLPELLQSIGLIDVTGKLVSVPLGSWGLDLGVLWRNNMEAFSESTAPLLSRIMGLTVEEYKANWKAYFDELDGRKPFTNIHSAWGRVSSDPSATIDWSLCPPFSL